jgi:hypothetical protein
MTETPTEDTQKTRSGGAYLPKLPDGWAYSLALVGPDNQRIDVTPDSNGGVDGAYEMEVETGTGTLPPVKADSLSEAAKMGVKAVKALAVVRTHRAAAQAAEEQFRAAIGRPSPQGEDGALVPPKFDKGGMQPGLSKLSNDTGEPEPVERP